MSKRKAGAIVLSALALLGIGIVIGAGIGLAIATNREKPDSNRVPPEQPTARRVEPPDVVHLQLSVDVRLTLVDIPGVSGMYATDTPITNSQYHVAVKDGGVPAPVFGKLLDAAPWEKVLWKGGKYPDGQQTCAVLFVNEAEAEKYCRWLERRFPDYEVQLPGVARRHSAWAERDCRLAVAEIEPELSHKVSPSLKTAVDPRPSRDAGPEHLSKNGRFWHAPRTNELVGAYTIEFIDSLYEKGRTDVFSGDQDPFFGSGMVRRYTRLDVVAGGSLGEMKFSVRPNTFRVVATLKGSPKGK